MALLSMLTGSFLKKKFKDAGDTTLGKIARVAAPAAALSGLGYLGYKAFKENQIEKPKMVHNDTGNKTVDKVADVYDEVDRKSGGFVKPALYGLGAMGASYLLAKKIAGNKAIGEWLKKDRSYLDAQNYASKFIPLKRSPKEWDNFKKNYIKEYGEDAWTKYEKGVQSMTRDKDHYKDWLGDDGKSKDWKTLAKENPEVFGEAKSTFGKDYNANFIDYKVKDYMDKLHANKEIPLELAPALSLVPGKGWKPRPVNVVFNEYMQPTLKALTKLKEKAFEGGVREFDEQGNPLFGHEKAGGGSTILGTDGETFNPQTEYINAMNEMYRDKIMNDPEYGLTIPDNPNDSHFKMPKEHPYMQNSLQLSKMFPNSDKTRAELRQFFGRKYNDYGDMSPEQFDEVVRYRMLGGRKLGAAGEPKTKTYTNDRLSNIGEQTVTAAHPGFKDYGVFPWSKQVLDMEDTTGISKKGGKYNAPKGDAYDLTVGDIKGYSVPKTIHKYKIPEIQFGHPSTAEALNKFQPWSNTPYADTSQGEENTMTTIGARTNRYKPNVIAHKNMTKDEYNSWLKQVNRRTNETARTVGSVMADKKSWNKSYNSALQGKGLYGRDIWTGYNQTARDTRDWTKYPFDLNSSNKNLQEQAQRAFKAEQYSQTLPGILQDYNQSWLERFGNK